MPPRNTAVARRVAPSTSGGSRLSISTLTSSAAPTIAAAMYSGSIGGTMPSVIAPRRSDASSSTPAPKMGSSNIARIVPLLRRMSANAWGSPARNAKYSRNPASTNSSSERASRRAA